jgi:hypothetical protein
MDQRTRHRRKIVSEAGECRTCSTSIPALSFTSLRNSCGKVELSYPWASNHNRPILGGRLASLTQEQLNALARHGAQARINELRQEIAAIEQAFPDLRTSSGGRSRKQRSALAEQRASASDTPAEAPNSDSGAKGRRGWSDTQRKAAAARMKAYWAKRKAGRKK